MLRVQRALSASIAPLLGRVPVGCLLGTVVHVDADAGGCAAATRGGEVVVVATKAGVAAQGPRGARGPRATRTTRTAFDYRATRSMVNFYEIFDKEKRAAGRKRLQAEMRCVVSSRGGSANPRLFRRLTTRHVASRALDPLQEGTL